MNRSEHKDFNSMSTFDLAFNLAMGKYSESEKFEVLDVIRSREQAATSSDKNPSNADEGTTLKTNIKPPLKGSKSEKIYKLALEGKTPTETFDILNKKGIKVYFPEVYRIFKKYGIS